MNISHAAFDVGFALPASFIRSYSKVVRKSPKNYRREQHVKYAF